MVSVFFRMATPILTTRINKMGSRINKVGPRIDKEGHRINKVGPRINKVGKPERPSLAISGMSSARVAVAGAAVLGPLGPLKAFVLPAGLPTAL